MEPISIALIGARLFIKHKIRRRLQNETERSIQLILILLRDGYSIDKLHKIARKKRAWSLEDPTEAEWRELFMEGNDKHIDEVFELVNWYHSDTTRALVKAVVKDGDAALANMRVQRAKGIIPDLVEAGYDMHQLMNIFAGFDGQNPGKEELKEALLVVVDDGDASRALLHLAVELGQLYHETGQVCEVVGLVAEVGLEALISGMELLRHVAEFFADLAS